MAKGTRKKEKKVINKDQQQSIAKRTQKKISVITLISRTNIEKIINNYCTEREGERDRVREYESKERETRTSTNLWQNEKKNKTAKNKYKYTK